MPVYWTGNTSSWPRATAFSPPPYPGITICWFVPWAFTSGAEVMVNVNRGGDGTALYGGTISGAVFDQYQERCTRFDIGKGKGTFANPPFAPSFAVGYKQSDHSAVYSNTYFSSPIAAKTGYIQTPAIRYDTSGAQFSSGWMHIDDLWAPVKDVPVTFDWELWKLSPDGHGGVSHFTEAGQTGATIDPATGMGSYIDPTVRITGPNRYGPWTYLYILRHTAQGYGIVVLILPALNNLDVDLSGYGTGDTPPSSLSVMSTISLPTGGGSPRLHAVMTRSYVDVVGTEKTTGDLGGFPTFTVTNTLKWRQSAVRCVTSNDFGETFEPGADVGVKAIDGTAITDDLNGIDTVSRVFLYDPGAFQYNLDQTHYSAPYLYRNVRIRAFAAAPDGSLYVNGLLGPTDPAADDYPPDSIDTTRWQWAAARMTNDATGKSGWRDSATANQTPIVNPATSETVGHITGGCPVWWTRGNQQGSRGAGGNSLGPSVMLLGCVTDASGARSFDGGDTWEFEPGNTTGGGPAAVQHLRGVSFDGANVSPFDFLGPGGTRTNVGGSGLLVHSTEDTVARTIAVNSSTLAVTVLSQRGALVHGATWQVSASPAKVFRLGAPVVGWAWPSRIVLMIPVTADVIAVYISEDDGATWRQTVWTSDCGASWKTGDWSTDGE